MPERTDDHNRGQGSTMTRDQRVLREAERWFRAVLCGAVRLRDHEFDLFTAVAERQVTLGDVYLPTEARGTTAAVPLASSLPVTLPPPSSSEQRALIERSKATLPPRR